jgi:hypothetical protein
LIITNAINGPKLLLTGHKTNILIAENNSAMKSVLTGPIESDRKPHARRPTAEEKLNPATRPAPAEGERPREVEYKGRKKGGTKRGKVPMVPAKNRVVNCTFLNRFHSINVAVVIGVRSLINQAAGRPVARVVRPMIRNVHAGPSFWITPFMAKEMIVPPRPPPA